MILVAEDRAGSALYGQGLPRMEQERLDADDAEKADERGKSTSRSFLVAARLKCRVTMTG